MLLGNAALARTLERESGSPALPRPIASSIFVSPSLASWTEISNEPPPVVLSAMVKVPAIESAPAASVLFGPRVAVKVAVVEFNAASALVILVSSCNSIFAVFILSVSDNWRAPLLDSNNVMRPLLYN